MFYYFIFLIISLLAIIEPKSLKKKERLLFLFFHFSLLILFIGLRDETGTDWIHYYKQFFSGYNEHMEIGYIYLTNIFRWLVDDYNLFVLFHSILYIGVFFLAIKNKHKVGYIVLLLYTGHLLGVMGSNRQVLALMICILAGEKLYRGQVKTFFALVFMSSLFHSSALIFSMIYFLKKLSSRCSLFNYVVIFIILVAFNFYLVSSDIVTVISNKLIGSFSPGGKIHGQLIVYASDQYRPDLLTSIMMIVKRVSTLFVLILMIKFFINSNISTGFYLLGKRFQFYFSSYFFSIVLLLLFQPIFPIIATRGGQYFYMYEIFLFSIIVSRVKQTNYIIFTLFFILFCFVRLSLQFSHDSNLLLPYKAVWYNTDVERTLY